MNLTVRQLQAFVLVAQLGSFTKAAQAMHLTQSALSLLVRELESALNTRLIDRTTRALHRAEDATALVVAGGVAANGAVRASLQALANDNALRFVAPPLWLCTDNAAMIAWAGAERFAAGLTDPLDMPARPRWPLDPTAEAVRGAGVKA